MSDYTDTVRERVLTPQAMEDVQRAAQLLRACGPVVKEALDLLAPIEWALDDLGYALIDAGGGVTDEENEAVRAGIYGEAVDLAFDLLEDAKRISYRQR